jgi:hypothetical protein
MSGKRGDGEEGRAGGSGGLAATWKRASPPARRWGGKFATPKFRPRRRKSFRPIFADLAKPHGQES